MKSNTLLDKVLNYLFLSVMSILFVMPMIFTLLSSFKTKLEIFSAPFSLPKEWLFSNYAVAWQSANMSGYFFNSLVQSGATVIVTMVLSSMLGYALARFDFKLNKFLNMFFLLGMMIPLHTILVPISYLITF